MAGTSRPTLAQVAREAGCSVSTVSAVLTGRTGNWASPQTQQRVLAAADRLNYRPNLAARSLRGGATQTIGLITPALNVEVTMQKIAGFEAAARAAGYVSIMTFSPNDPAVEDRLVTTLMDRSVDGLAVYPTETGRHRELVKLTGRGFPVVTIDAAGRLDLACDDVSTDYQSAGRLQVEHLLGMGRRRICQINTLPSCYTKDQLRTGAVQAARRAGLRMELVELQVPGDAGSIITSDMCQQLARALRRLRGKVDAVVSYDLVAAACARVARDLGIAVPGELAIVGSDDGPTAVNGAVALTTLAQSAADIGRQAFALLHARMVQPDVKPEPRRLLIEPTLVVRASTRASSEKIKVRETRSRQELHA